MSGDIRIFIGECVEQGKSIEDTVHETQEAFAVLDRPWVDTVDPDFIEEVWLEETRKFQEH